jgi:phage tail-like protein
MANNQSPSTGTHSRTDIITSFHFYIVDAHRAANVPDAIFTEMSGLEVEITVDPYEEGGINDHVHKLPGRVKVSDITLRNGITPTNELWKWFADVLRGKKSRKNVSIVIVNQQKLPVQTWSFFDALPIKWTGPQLKADQSAALVQSLVLTHRGMTLEQEK